MNEVKFLNSYKVPHDPTASKPLLNCIPSAKRITTGDFNSGDWAGKSTVTNLYGQEEEIEKWAGSHNLINHITGEPIHGAGNTLDLILTNIICHCVWVDRDECTASLHFSISGIVPFRLQKIFVSSSLLKITKDQLHHFSYVISLQRLPKTLLNTEEETEKFATKLCMILVGSVKAVFRLVNQVDRRSRPWQTLDCKVAHLIYKIAVTET